MPEHERRLSFFSPFGTEMVQFQVVNVTSKDRRPNVFFLKRETRVMKLQILYRAGIEAMPNSTRTSSRC
jgi:hypothetical protein